MSKESVIQSMKEELDYRNAFGKYITSCEGYLLAMHALSAPSVQEEYAKWKLMDLGAIMTREELQNEFGDAVCVYCNKNIIPEHNLGIGCLCEGNWCEEAQDGYATENNIELED